MNAAEPLRAAYYRETLHDWMARLKRSSRTASAPGAEKAPDAATCAQLGALGYVHVRCK